MSDLYPSARKNPLNLQPVNPPLPAFAFNCACCGRQNMSNDYTRAILGGKPFTYACARCGLYLERDDPVFMREYQDRAA